MAAWKLSQYDQAIPYFMAVANQPGHQHHGDALRMAGVSLTFSGQQDEQLARNRQQAQEKYRKAYQLLSQRFPNTSMTPENAKAVQDILSWLNQRLANRSANVIQWSSAQPGDSPSDQGTGKQKKRGWFASFFEPSS